MGCWVASLALPDPPFTLLCVLGHSPLWSLSVGLLCPLVPVCFGQWPSLARDSRSRRERCWDILLHIPSLLHWQWLRSSTNSYSSCQAAISYSCRLLPCASNCFSCLLQALAAVASFQLQPAPGGPTITHWFPLTLPRPSLNS